MPYGLRLLEQLLAARRQVYLVYSQTAQIVLQQECGLRWSSDPRQTEMQLRAQYATCGTAPGKEGESQPVDTVRLRVFGCEAWFAPIASGSGVADAMVVCPCTMGTLARIAQGTSDDLITRAADVCLKEGRKLILVPRETPFSALHLENMLKLARLGACILPPNPGFYQHPHRIEDLVDFVVARILDQLHIPHDLLPPWGM